MNRDELIDAGLQAVLVEANHLGQELTFRDELVVIIDAVEPIIRADEQEKVARWKAEATEVMLGWERVWEALGSPGRLGESKAAAALALISGGSDE